MVMTDYAATRNGFKDAMAPFLDFPVEAAVPCALITLKLLLLEFLEGPVCCQDSQESRCTVPPPLTI